MEKTILIVSSGQPSLNPRLVKEADALAEAGYEVTVLYAYWNDWGTQYDDQLLPQKKWQAIRVAGDPQNKKFLYLLSRSIHKVSLTLFKKTKSSYWADFAIARSSYFLIREARKHKAGLYIAHNLGALPAVADAAKTFKKPFGFDAEDFHRNEVNNDLSSFDSILKQTIEERYIPQTTYFTASSPLIAEAYRKLFPGIDPVVVLNVFPNENTKNRQRLLDGDKLKLFWFSQTIGANRGLETVIEALKHLPYTTELHLLGYADAYTKSLYKSNRNIFIYEPIPPDQIISFASQFDIGLATETGYPVNRDICLTNKVFIYIQAGLAVIASDTTAQTELTAKYHIGRIYKKDDKDSLKAALNWFIDCRNKLQLLKDDNYQLGRQQLNWDVEKIKFLMLIKQVLTRN